jgi:hypothetical protein
MQLPGYPGDAARNANRWSEAFTPLHRSITKEFHFICRAKDAEAA